MVRLRRTESTTTSWVRELFRSRRPERQARRLGLEVLEDRLAPATFTGNNTALTIDLNNVNEVVTLSTNGTTITAALTGGTATDGGGNGTNVSGFGTSTASITSAGFTSITITDSAAGTSVAFANSSGNYPQSFSITLNDPASGNVTFTGASTFTASFTATTNAGFIASDPLSLLMVSGGSSNLALTATGHDILLQGAVSIAGTTSLAASVVQIDNPVNNFAGAFQLSGPEVASVRDANNLNLGASNLAFGNLGQTAQITAGGNITQSGALTTTAAGGTTATLSVTSNGGSITLTNAGNNLSTNVALALSVSGTGTATIVNSAGLTLGNTTLGTGALTLTANGTIGQRGGTTIQTGGAISCTVSANNSDVLLNKVGNQIAGAVTLGETTSGFLRDVSLRNAAAGAQPPTGTPLTTPNDVRNLTVSFDNNGVSLPGYSITGNLTVTAGGDVTQSAAETIGGNTTVTVLGDFGINLTNNANALTGSVSLNDTQSTQSVAVTNSSVLTLGACDLGRGTFSATAVTGIITSTSAITQRKDAGAATFTVTAGTSVSLTGANDFTGGAVFVGTGLTTLSVRDTDYQAHYAELTVPGTVTDLTVQFDNAGIVLPTLGLINLNVTALGIFQQTNSILTLSGTGTFTAGAYPLNLSNAGNHFANLTLNNSGRNDVTVVEASSVTFTGTSNLGTGRLTVTAGSNITETGGAIIKQATGGPEGNVQFDSTIGSVTLNGNNVFRGTLSVSVSGAVPSSVNNTTTLVLGAVSSTNPAASFAAVTNSGNIVQDPNSVLNLVGPSSFTATGSITLTSQTNTFTGAVSLNAGSAAILDTGAVVVAASNVTNVLSITTGGSSSDSITQSGSITGGSAATFNSGAGSIMLSTLTNDFGAVSIFSTAAVVNVADANALNVGTIQLGGGTLTLTTGGGGGNGNLNLAGGASGIVQTTGSGGITLNTPAGANINLGSSVNVLLGAVTVQHATNVTLQTQGNLTFAPTSTITGTLTATSGGILTLPTTLTNLAGLAVSAVSTTISSDITTTTGGTSFAGAVNFTGNRNITSAGAVSFTGNVTPGGTLTFTLPTGQNLALSNGTWNQGANALTVNGTTVGFQIGNGSGAPAQLIMTGGTLSMPGSGTLTVATDGTLQVGAAAGPETVTLANGSGNLVINGALAVGFGTVNDELIKSGSGTITLGPTSQLIGSGLAGTTATAVLVSQTELLVGRFVNSVDATGNPADFFAGSDIVTPAYSFTQVTIKAGGVAAPSGTATGFLPDGDTFSVTSSLGATSGLATVVDTTGQLDVVVRNTTSTAASTLTFSTTGGGNGQISVGGLAVHSPGAVTVTAPAANFIGSFTTAGTLTALTARNLGGVNNPFSLTDGGLSSASTSITAGVVQDTIVTLAGTMGSLKAASVTNGTSLTALKFGTLTTTGNAAALNPGDFNPTLTSTTTVSGTVVTSATVAGTLGGTWDVRGKVGTVTTSKTASWTLGTIAGAAFANGGLLSAVTSLSLGQVSGAVINATGALASLTAADVGSSSFNALSFGTVKVTGSAALGLVGNFSGSTLTAAGNANGVALASLSIAGNLSSSTLTFQNGDVTAIAVGQSVTGSAITAIDTGTRGALKAITAGQWQSTNVTACMIGSLQVIGNLAADLFGNFTTSTVTMSGNAAGVGLGTFSASGSVSSSTFNVQNGNLTTFTVGRQISLTTVQLTNAAFGILGTIQAGDWASGVTVLARTIGTVASVGAAEINPASPALLGGIISDTITAYQATGTAAAIGKLTTKGDLSGSTVTAQRGITALSVGRSVTNTNIVADDALTGALNVGRIATLTAGAWSSSSVAVNTFGTVSITGYATPESSSSTFANGDVTGGTFIAHGATPTTPVGIGTFTVARHFQSSSVIVAPFGIGTLTVGGSVSGGSQVVTANPTAPASGFLTTFSAGDLNSATVRADSIGTLKTTGSSAFGLLGSINLSTVAVIGSASTKTGPQAVGTLSVAGDFSDSKLDAPATVGTISIAGRVFSNTLSTRLQAGYAAGSKVTSLSVGAWGQSGSSLTTDLIAQSVGTFSLKGNAGRGFVGTADEAFIDLLGASAGVGLGTFTASGTVTKSLFRVSNGDVTSFTALRFSSSDLLVGFRFVKGSDVTLTPAAANWTATHKIGTFKTTAPYSSSDVTDSASFADSNVVAAVLGNITLSGINPVTTNATTFGVAFRVSAGLTAQGTVKINGAATSLTPPFPSGQFHYLGLAG